MKKIFKIIRHIVVFLFVGFPAFLCALISKIFIRDLWLVCECGKHAQDNGYFFFKYLRENHPNQKAVFVISKKSPDYQKVAKLGNTCGYKTFGHWFYYFLCSKEVTSSPHTKPSEFLHKMLWLNKTYFLQHGIIRNYIEVYSSKKIKLKKFFVTTNKEEKLILDKFGFNKNVVCKTGLARFDNLNDSEINKDQILVMPTWRKYLAYLSEDEFKKSTYYLTWQKFLNSEELDKVLKQYNKKIVFYPHRSMQSFINSFSTNSSQVKILSTLDADVQTLLKQSSLLITDYSSVFFDFVYMKKPVLWYIFDMDEFYTTHLQLGYFNEKEDYLGKHAVDEENLIKLINESVKKEFTLNKKELNDIDEFFTFIDNKNCERIYNEIKKG